MIKNGTRNLEYKYHVTDSGKCSCHVDVPESFLVQAHYHLEQKVEILVQFVPDEMKVIAAIWELPRSRKKVFSSGIEVHLERPRKIADLNSTEGEDRAQVGKKVVFFNSSETDDCQEY